MLMVTSQTIELPGSEENEIYSLTIGPWTMTTGFMKREKMQSKITASKNMEILRDGVVRDEL